LPGWRTSKRFLAKRGRYVGRLSLGDLKWLLERTQAEKLHPRYQEELEQLQKSMKEVASMMKLSLGGLLGPRG